jgi:tetratricopeptide (TPR) repeat protein
MVESVAWITELKNTLSGVFFLGAGLAYLKFDRKREKKYYAIALILFLSGVFAKSVIVTLPVALLVVFWWMRGRIGWKRDVVPLLPFLAIGIISGLFTAWVERRFIGAVGSEFSFTLVDRCLIAGRAVWFYLAKLLWPADLIFIYPRWHIDSTAVWQYLFPVALLLAAVLLWGLRNRSRAPLAVLLYFAVTLFPSLGFFNIYPFRYSFVADHFQYLASIGPIAAAAASIEQGTGLLKEGFRRPVQPLLRCMLLSVLFLLCWQQSGMYSDAETLYRTTMRRNPDCWMAHYNLGILLAKSGRTDEAQAHYLKTLEIHPSHVKAHINLGILLARSGRTDEAIVHYQKALGINPNSAEAHYNLGILLAGMGQTDAAMDHYLEALRIDPNLAEAHNNLGNLLAEMGRANEAVAYYSKALEINPNDKEIRNNLGVLLAKMGRTDEALTHFQKALELDPSHADAYNNLGILLAKVGRTDEAIAHYQKALEINANYAETHHNLGILLANAGRTDEAIAHWRRALEIHPDEITTLRRLASALVQRGQWSDAASVLQNALALAESGGDETRARMIAQMRAKLQTTVNSSLVDAKTHAQR